MMQVVQVILQNVTVTVLIIIRKEICNMVSFTDGNVWFLLNYLNLGHG